MVATWYGDVSPHLSLLKPAVTGGSKGNAPGYQARLVKTINIQENVRQLILDKAVAALGSGDTSKVLASSARSGVGITETWLWGRYRLGHWPVVLICGDGSMYSQAYARAWWVSVALLSSSVAARDRGHLKGVAGSGWAR